MSMAESRPRFEPARLIVVMGVAGCGKSTIGAGIAERLGGRFLDGDDFHPPENVAKMSAGTPLTDDDRWPWLEAIATAMRKHDGIAVAACSALRRAYRDHITRCAGEPVLFLHLDGTRELILGRMSARQGHFMPVALLDSQFATLEPPGPDENAVSLSIDHDPETIIRAGCAAIRAGVGPTGGTHGTSTA